MVQVTENEPTVTVLVKLFPMSDPGHVIMVIESVGVDITKQELLNTLQAAVKSVQDEVADD